MLDFNLALDKAILRPVTCSIEVVPIRCKRTFRFLHLRGPVIFANDLFQGELDRAGTACCARVNSTFGILGINDFAAEVGIEKHDEDFDKPRHLVEHPPVLPIFDLQPRDGVGLLADTLIDPFTWLTPLEYRIGRSFGTAVDKRAILIKSTI